MGFDSYLERAFKMIENRGPHEIANEIRMKRQLHPGSFVIVEGPKDLQVYRRFFDPNGCRLVPSFDKEKAMRALDLLEKEGFPGIVAIVDSDFWVLKKHVPSSENLFTTDTHDLETMIIRSPALEKVLAEYASEAKIEKFQQANGASVREKLLGVARVIGLLRWLSERDGLGLDFDGLAYKKFTSMESLEINISNLIRIVKSRSKAIDLNEQEMTKKLRELMQACIGQIWHICCGHDLVNLLSIGLRKLFGSRKAVDVNSEHLEVGLRLAYELAFFVETELYNSLKDWGQKDTRFRIVLSMNPRSDS
jgi:hypothetical protein